MARFSVGKAVKDYCERLTVTQGDSFGKPFTVLPWERRFITKAFKPTVSTAALSMARANGKSALIGAIAAAHIDDPRLRQPRAEILVIASSFGQARIIFDHSAAFLGEKIQDKKVWRLSDNNWNASLMHRASGDNFESLGK